MATSKQDILNQFKISRIIWPILIGLLVVGYMFVQDLRSDSTNIQEAIQAIDWKGQTFLWLGAALVMMVLRDVAYIWRMRLLTEKEMSWRACFEVTMLWEFASAATPSIVGGTAVAVFMFIKEKISAGKSAAIVFITIFLDEFYYLAILPIAIIFAGNSNMFATLQGTSGAGAVFGSSVIASFWIAYGAILAYVTFLALGLFVKPQAIHMLIKKLFLTKLLYRWRFGAFRTADDLLNASRQYRRKPFKFWLAAGVSTLLAWMSRYLVLNCILAAFATAALGLTDHVIIYARQAVLFIWMIVSPTPGSSGIAEGGFQLLFSDFTPLGLGLALATLWRLITYYPYLFIGIPILPRWLARVYKKKGEKPQQTPSPVH